MRTESMVDTNSKTRSGQSQLQEAREFDFLEGDWDAVCHFPRPDGSWGVGPGTLKATRILDGCASMEFFEGPYQREIIKGLGLRAFNPKTRQWEHTSPPLGVPVKELIERNPEKMSGTPVFPGTLVPIKHLFDYLEGGESLEEFLDHFPTVSREQAVAVLSASRESLLNTPTNTQARMEFMSQAVNDELFLADLNATMEDFKDADHLEQPA